MNLDSIRKKRLNELITEFGTHQALADRLDCSSGYISQLATGRRPITEKSARKFELALGKSSGWFDALDTPSGSENFFSDELKDSVSSELLLRLQNCVSLYLNASETKRRYIDEVLGHKTKG